MLKKYPDFDHHNLSTYSFNTKFRNPLNENFLTGVSSQHYTARSSFESTSLSRLNHQIGAFVKSIDHPNGYLKHPQFRSGRFACIRSAAQTAAKSAMDRTSCISQCFVRYGAQLTVKLHSFFHRLFCVLFSSILLFDSVAVLFRVCVAFSLFVFFFISGAWTSVFSGFSQFCADVRTRWNCIKNSIGFFIFRNDPVSYCHFCVQLWSMERK